MPSGAKKRKAAKKKKEINPNNNHNLTPAPTQGDGDVKQQDDRQSDFGEASSTTSQDPSHHDLLTEGEEEKIEKSETVSNLPTVEGVNSECDHVHGVLVEGIEVPVERGLKIEDEFDEKNGRFDHDEIQRKSYDGGSSGSSRSSSSSSDDESHGIKSSKDVVDAASVSVKVHHSLHEESIEPVSSTTIGEASDAVVDSIPPVISDKVSLLSESVADTSTPASSSVSQRVVEEKKGSFEEPVDSNACIIEETDDRLSLSYNSPIASLDKEVDAENTSGVKEPLLVPPPRPLERTSWKSCCGLFELFAGSGR